MAGTAGNFMARLLVRAAERGVVEEAGSVATRTAAGAAARSLEETAAHAATNAGSEIGAAELRAAARAPVVHEATEVAVARTVARENARPALVTAAGAVVVGGGATAYTLYNTNARIGQVINGVGQVPGLIGDLFRGARDEAEKAAKAASNAVHLPNMSDIEEAAERALHGAHDIGTELAGPASNALTIVIVLGTAVAVYEGYRFLNR